MSLLVGMFSTVSQYDFLPNKPKGFVRVFCYTEREDSAGVDTPYIVVVEVSAQDCEVAGGC